MTLRALVVLFLILVVFIWMPALGIQAQQFPGDTGVSGIVPCGDEGEPGCGVCELVSLAQEGINFGVYLTVFVATLLFVYAGFLYITAGGDPGKIKKATGIFWKVLVGMIIVLVAWLIVDTLMKTFYENSDLSDSGFGPWNKILCVGGPGPGAGPPERGSIDEPEQGPVEIGDEPMQVSVCNTCVPLPSNIPTNGNACAGNPSQCQVDGELASSLNALQLRAASPQYGLSADSWRVSEAWPPVAQHSASCHRNGTCVDVSFAPSGPGAVTASPRNVQNFIDAAAGSGLRAVYEVQTEARKRQLEAGGVTDVIVVTGINREHFSVYKD